MATLRAGFDILDSDDSKRVIKRTMKAMNIDPGETEESRDLLKQLFTRIGRFKDNLIVPEERLHGSRHDCKSQGNERYDRPERMDGCNS